MNNDNQTITRNTRTVIGPFSGVVRDIDDIINIDTTAGVVELTLQNIKGSGLMLNPRCIYINDIGGNLSTNNLIIHASGGDKINNSFSVNVFTDGANVKCNIANQTEWTATLAGTGTATTVFTDKSIFGDGAPLTPLGVRGIYQNILFVSPDGDDSIAEKGRIALAYKTIDAAVIAANSGDLIWVMPGTYSVSKSIAKNGLSYYFNAGAIISARATPFSDSGLGAITFNVYGYLSVNGSMAFTESVVQLREGSTCFFQFDGIYTSCGATFFSQNSYLTVRGRYCSELGQYVARLNSGGLIDVEIDEIFNVNVTGACAIRFNAVGTEGVSRFVFNKLTNNGAGSFGAITVLNSTMAHRLDVRGYIVYQPTGPTFLDSALQVQGGGFIDFVGTIKSTRKIAQIYGNGGVPNEGFINIRNSNMFSSYLVEIPIRCNNPSAWIKISNSYIQSNNTNGVVSIGEAVGFNSDTNGNFECRNTTIKNSGVGGPSKGILKPFDVSVNSKCVLDDVTILTSGGGYAIYKNGGAPNQTISILNGGCIGNENIEAGIVNDIVGTNYIFSPTMQVSPYNEVTA